MSWQRLPPRRTSLTASTRITNDDDEDDDFDELSVEGLFLHVTAMWSVLGAIDSDDRLTPLGWWGLPEAMRRAWTE